ncbi:hypothetical protein EPIB1_2002 [Tritonibacter mobilis]|nr:hypothetical protein EPIB1_2002 [Tritonibacter mobilis]
MYQNITSGFRRAPGFCTQGTHAKPVAEQRFPIRNTARPLRRFARRMHGSFDAPQACLKFRMVLKPLKGLFDLYQG